MSLSSRKAGLLFLMVLLLVPTVGFAQEDGSGDGRYLVKFKDFRGASAAVRAHGGNPVLELEPQRAVAAYLPQQALEGLSRNPNVEYIEVDARRYLMAQTTPYGIPMVQADLVSAANAGAATVCIIDSGYYLAHTDLQDGNATGTNDSGSGLWYDDTCGHGTHVAGTIAALNNTLGVVGVIGTGGLNLHIEKVFNGSDCAWAYSSSLVTALNRCRNAVSGTTRKLVVSMSLGGSLSNTTENNAFQDAYSAGVLSIAAAGNDGSTRKSYPASYTSVVSVAAVDSAKLVADFSQKNDAVELAAPGVGVLSTVPFAAVDITVGTEAYLGSNVDGSARVNVTAALVDGGLCTANGAWSGKTVLCERGVISFAEKVAFVQNSGGAGAVIYNNVSGGFAATLNGTSTIPAISISQEDGKFLVANKLGSSSTLHNATGAGSGYEAWDGTSMATPHVSGVAALVWSNFPAKTNADIRAALQQSAQDLGTAGKDNSYGYGLVQAKAAYDLLSGSVPPPPPPPPPADSISLTVTKVRSGKSNYALLKWSGATSTNVLVKQNGATVATTANDGEHQLGPIAKGTHSFQVCDSAGTPCSNTVSLRF